MLQGLLLVVKPNRQINILDELQKKHTHIQKKKTHIKSLSPKSVFFKKKDTRNKPRSKKEHGVKNFEPHYLLARPFLGKI